MRAEKIPRWSGVTIALLVAVLGGAIAGLIASVAAADDDTRNVRAVHDRSSSQYRTDCTKCHAAVLRERSLDQGTPAIATAHTSMLVRGLIPGSGDRKCVFCHRTVDWERQGSGSLRKHVDTRLCQLCHAPEGPGKQFYQVGLSLDRLDGAGYYGLLCEGCHGELARSEVRGESAREIRKKIAEDEGGMGPLSVLLEEEIEAIAAALGGGPDHD